MLLTVLFLSGAILSATAISGYLMFHQIKNLTDVSSSTKSIFAADAGIEWSLYKYFQYYNECYDASPPSPACNNGIDDDGNGKTDFPEDNESCTDPNDPEEGVPAPPQFLECDYKPMFAPPGCSNGIDDNNDGTKDFPEDADDCTSADDPEEGVPPKGVVVLKIVETTDPTTGKVNGAITTGSFGKTGRALQIDFLGAIKPLFSP